MTVIPLANCSDSPASGPNASAETDWMRMSVHFQVAGTAIEGPEPGDQDPALGILVEVRLEYLPRELPAHGRFGLERLDVVRNGQSTQAGDERI
jgi:hypothetical protein